MKVSGNIPAGAPGFGALLKTMSSRPDRGRLLRTAFRTGFVSDGVLLTRMSIPESEEVRRAHFDAVAADKEYQGAAPFDLRGVLPPYCGPVVEACRFAGTGVGKKLVLLTGHGLMVLAEAPQVLAGLARHPGAQWRFGCKRPGGPGYWNYPAVLLRGQGLVEKGEVLGALAPVAVRPREAPFRVPAEGCLRLVVGKSGYSYQPVLNMVAEEAT